MMDMIISATIPSELRQGGERLKRLPRTSFEPFSAEMTRRGGSNVFANFGMNAMVKIDR